MATGDPSAEPQPGLVVHLLIISCGILTGLSMTGLVPILPALQTAFAEAGGAGYLVKAVVAVVGFSVMVAAPFAAFLTRRFKCGDVIIASFVVYVLAALLSSLAPNLPLLIAARFVQGVAVGVGVTTVLALAGILYVGIERDRRLGLHMAISAITLFLLMPAAGALGAINWRLTPLLGLLGLCHLILAVLARSKLDFHLGGQRAAPSATDGDDRRTFIWIGVLTALIGGALYSSPAFTPFKVVDLGMGAAGAIGMVTALSVAGSALASFGYPIINKRLGGKRLYVVALALSIACALTIALSRDAATFIVATFLSGIGGGLLVTHIYGHSVQFVAAERRVVVTGLVKSCSFAGLFVGPVVLQAVVETTSNDAAFIGIAALFALSMIVVLTRPAPAKARVVLP